MAAVFRLGGITRVLAKHGLGGIADRLRGRKQPNEPAPAFPSPHRIRLVLEELGPSFIKLGQLMSTRADLLPPAVIEELRKLQDRVPQVPFSQIKDRVESELDSPLTTLFNDFDENPIAAASIAQVHFAVMPDGWEVAVKVVRPGIDQIIRKDIQLMYLLASRLENLFDAMKVLDLKMLVREFERTIFNELDMQIEGGNIERFSQNFRTTNEIKLPKLYWSHSTKSVLVMDRIPGVKVDQVDEIKKMGIDPKNIALIGLRSFSRQLFDFGFFHGDPHPGNTIVMPDGNVGLVDFGIVGFLDETIKQYIALLFLGYAEHNYDLVMEAIESAGLIKDLDEAGRTAFRQDLIDASEPFYGRGLQAISVRDIYDQVIGLILKHRITLPRNLLLLLKTFVQTEALGKILGSEASLLRVMKPYAKEFIDKNFESEKLMADLGRDARLFSGLAQKTPRLFFDIVRRTAEGRHQITVRHNGFEDIAKKSEKGLNRLTIGIVLAASILAAALVLNSTIETFLVSVPFINGPSISLTALFGLMGYGIATLLGIWLIVSIIKSGKL